MYLTTLILSCTISKVTSIQFNQKWNVLKSDVIEIRGIKVDTRPYLKTVEPTIESSNFVPFISQQVTVNL